MIRLSSLLAAYLLSSLICPLGSSLARAEPTIEDVAGKTVHSIEFIAAEGVSYDHLKSNLSLRVGDRISAEALEKAASYLRERELFQQVSYSATEVEDGVAVVFSLSPIFTLGEFEFYGARAMEDRVLRRLSGLRVAEPLDPQQLDSAKVRLLEGYRREGFPSAKITVRVRRRPGVAQYVVRFDIEEGSRLTINQVNIKGELPPDLLLLTEQINRRAEGAFATQDNLVRLKKEVLNAVRREGYLRASADLHYEPLVEQDDRVDLAIELEVREPISLIFRGNRVFTVDQLLEPLKLESRTVPFSPGAVQTLCREIRDMYEDRGYFFAHVTSSELKEENGRTYYQISIEEGTEVSVRNLLFSGNSTYSSETLKQLIQPEAAAGARVFSLEEDQLSHELIVSQLLALQRFYDDEGFVDTEVSFALLPTSSPSEVDLEFRIIEAPRREVASTSIEWIGLTDELLETAEVASLLGYNHGIATGDVLRQADLESRRQAMLSTIRKAGFPSSSVELNIIWEKREVKFVATLGPQVRIGQIIIAGSAITRDRIIKDKLDINTGQVYRVEDIRNSEQALSRLGLFRSVAVVPKDGVVDGPVEDLVVRVVERDSGNFEVGTTASSEDGLHIFGEVTQRNIGGRNQALKLAVNGYLRAGDHAFDAGHARALFLQPNFLLPEGTLSIEAFSQYSLRVVDPFRLDRTGGLVALRGAYTEHLGGSFGFGVSDEQTSEVPADMVIGKDDVGNTVISFVKADLDWDRRDDQTNPREGFHFLGRTRVAADAFGSDVSFGEAGMQSSLLTPITHRLVWSNGVRGTIIEPFGDTEAIPLAERIFLGGRNSLRGYSRNAIGPRGDFGHIVGGDRALIFNTELQYDLTEDLVAVTFIDLGQTYLKNPGTFSGDALSPSKLRISPGLGAHYRTPVGPLSVEIGIATDREFGERWGRVLFAIGNAF